MNDPYPDPQPDPQPDPLPDAQEIDEERSAHPRARSKLVWDVLFFNVKLAADGIKDIVLSVLSLAAMIAGLVSGGDRPDAHFRRLLVQGRRVEHWINLFGRRHGDTSDKFVEPFQRKVFEELERQPWLNRASSQLGRKLDSVNESLASRQTRARGHREHDSQAADPDGDGPP